jgi:hypothetical protein
MEGRMETNKGLEEEVSDRLRLSFISIANLQCIAVASLVEL